MNLKVFGVQMLYLWKVLWHPIDSFYDIVYKGKGSVASASLIYVLYFVALVIQTMVTNFVFNPYGLHGTPIPQIFVMYVLPILVLVIANCLVSAIKGGQGTYKAVFIAKAYALAPVVIFIVPLALFSNILTGAEEAIYDSILLFVYAWMGFFIYLSIMEVHGYSITEAIRNTLWIVFAGAILVLFAFAFFGITFQSANFLYEFFREAIGYV